MASYNLNEILKKRASQKSKRENQEMDLGDTARVKVLSPMRQVMKRFMRNRLAIFGSCVLIFMFVFSFLGPFFYKYDEDFTNYKYEDVVSAYSYVQQRAEYTGYVLDPSIEGNRVVMTKSNSNINSMEKVGKTEMVTQAKDGVFYRLSKTGPALYTLSTLDTDLIASFGTVRELVGTYKTLGKQMQYAGEDLGEEFAAAAASNCKGKSGSFEFEDNTYEFKTGSQKKTFDIYLVEDEGFKYYGAVLGEAFETASQEATPNETFEFNGKRYLPVVNGDAVDVFEETAENPFMLYTQFGFDTYTTALPLTDEFKVQALYAAYGAGTFEAEAILDTEAFLEEEVAEANEGEHEENMVGMDEEPVEETMDVEPEIEVTYTRGTFHVAPSAEHEGVMVITTEDGTPYAELNTLVVRRYNGDDTMDLDLKYAIRDVVQNMMANDIRTDKLMYRIPAQTANGKNAYDEEGNLQYKEDSHMTINMRYAGEYVVDAEQTRYLIDKYASPSSEHIMGTDGDGFDVLARIMYGGRISLMVGFVVVILETVLGVIMGGLAGFFGGWVDNVIMRLVDIFYCLPFMPIMIIVGALMDAWRLDVKVRLFVLMAAMGIMGWAGIARLVRGQILSLREQEFMVAAEATGLPTARRIFRHLVPNVMPQLIVSATMGLGSTILSESTLSFLGLGVKHPMATWGSMINSVSSAAAMEQHAYIWIPVGLLICFTVIAFNFVGDGLRDAFDPKAKR